MNIQTSIAAEIARDTTLSPRQCAAIGAAMGPYADAMAALDKLPASSLRNAIRDTLFERYSHLAEWDDFEAAHDALIDAGNEEVRAENRGGDDVADLPWGYAS
jgi:hypothetical protein